MTKFDPFLSLDCAPTPSTLAHSKERKGSNFAIWQPWFKELYGVFSNRTYDSLDPTDESFIKDYEHFKSRTFELDRKLGAVLGRAFDDCLVTESIFKLLQVSS